MEWLQKAEGLLQAVDQRAKAVSSGQQTTLFGHSNRSLDPVGATTDVKDQQQQQQQQQQVEDLEKPQASSRPEDVGVSVKAPQRQRTTSSSKIELLKKKKRLEMERKKQLDSLESTAGHDEERQVDEPVPQEESDRVVQDDRIEKKMSDSNISTKEEAPKKEAPKGLPRKTSGGSKSGQTTGESHERMGKLLEALRKKNKQLESENIQLEEMITSMDAQVKKNEQDIAALNGSIKQLMKSKQETEDRSALLQNRLEESEALVISHKATIDSLEIKLQDKEKESATATAERSVSETHIIASLRKDVEAAETLLENERRAHALSRKNFAAREQELDESVTRAAAALSESQAKIEQYSIKLAESQERCMVLEADMDALSRKLPQSGEENGESSLSTTNGNMKVSEQRMQELEAELAAALREGASARNTLKTLEDDMSRIRTENIHLKQQLAKYHASDTVELKSRVKELTDALYSKQSQIENLTAERGALQMQLDRQGSFSRTPEGIRRRSAAVEKMFSGESFDNVVPMNTLGRGFERLANAPGHLGGAVQAGAKLLDAIALQAVILIRQSPLWRLGVFAYILGMHAFIYALLFFHQQVNMGSPGAIVDTTAVHTTTTTTSSSSSG